MHSTLPEARIHPGNVADGVNGASEAYVVLLRVGVGGLVVLEGRERGSGGAAGGVAGVGFMLDAERGGLRVGRGGLLG
jgi:hypothetical protein